MNTNWKDVLLGILVAYVVIDVLVSYTMMKRTSPSCLEKLSEAFSDSSGIIAVAIGIMVGVIVWYLVSLSKECFTRKNKATDNDKQDTSF